MFKNWWYTVGSSGIMLPIGAIIGLDSLIIPTGFQAFTYADDFYIVGASGTKTLGATDSPLITTTTTTSGAHTGGLQSAYGTDWGNGSGKPGTTYTPQGAHDHTVDFSYKPESSNLKLIQATAKSFVPENGILFSDGEISNAIAFDALEANGGYAKGFSVTGAGAAAHSIATNSSIMSHDHMTMWPNMADFGCGNTNTWQGTQFAHDHTLANTTVTGQIKHVVLRAWKAAAARIGGNPIVMYQSDIIPEGWLKCDGTLGTLDLRDCFIKASATGDGTISGNNQLVVDGLTDSFGHTHMYTGPATMSCDRQHPELVDHDHAITWSGEGLPPWFALNFIVKGNLPFAME